jgi:hypothetical protein
MGPGDSVGTCMTHCSSNDDCTTSMGYASDYSCQTEELGVKQLTAICTVPCTSNSDWCTSE